MSFEKISSQVIELVKAKKFNEALTLYQKELKPNCNIELIRKDKYLMSVLLHMFYKTEKFREALNFVQELKISQDKDLLDYGIKMYGWSIYRLLERRKRSDHTSELNDSLDWHNADQQTFHKLLISEAIKLLSILNLHKEEHYLLYSRLFFVLSDFITNQNDNDWSAYIRLIENISYQDFHKKGESKIIDGKNRQFAPDFEKWYLVTCKAFYLSGFYDKCIQNAREAISHISRFHNNNDIWIKRLMARSFFKLNKVSEAIKIYENDILINKNDWFLHNELAEIYHKINNIDAALKYSINAALIKGEFDYKVNLFQLIGEILLQKGEKELGEKHILLNYLIRRKNDWKIPQELSNKVEKMDKTLQSYDLDTLYQQISKYWESFLLNGEIAKVIPNKRIGWIKSENQDYFFKFGITSDEPQKIIEGRRVLFLIGKGFDRKNNQIKDEVKFVRIIS